MPATQSLIETAERFSARNYHPLPVVLERGEGIWMWDVEGRRFLDMLSAYSALNQGHRHPRIIGALVEQAERLTLTSRAFHNDQMGPFLAELCELLGYEKALPMNTGAEAVETAIKLARRWGYKHRGVAQDRARIVVCEGNFHGRTTTIISFSTEPAARDGFGPFTPGFDIIPFGDADALRQAITDETVAFLLEPIQGEHGVIIPPDGYLADVRRICSDAGILMIADEIQSGLGRVGTLLACDDEEVQPDVVILGKALGGGMLPVSAVVSSREIMSTFRPGSHGSTFGGNPLAAAVGRAVVRLLQDGTYLKRAVDLGGHLRGLLNDADLRVTAIRSRGLWFGLDLEEGLGDAHSVVERLAQAGVLCKDTHGRTIRLSPPLVVERDDLDWAVEQIKSVLG
jgi:ornithine--oxo-acid transaminase